MATFDDMAVEGKLTVYDKGFDEDAAVLRRVHHALGRHLVARGVSNEEPLRIECRALHRPRARRASRRARDGESGLRVVRVLQETAAVARDELA